MDRLLDFSHDDEVALDKERYRRVGGLYKFTREVAWPAVEAIPFVDNWHIGAICEFLEALYRGQIRFGVITMPPRFMKSLLASVSYPAWLWAVKPPYRIISSSYAEPLALRDAGKTLEVIRSARYQQLYGKDWRLKTDAVKEYKNTALGERFSTGVGGAATGQGGDLVMVDDPLKAADGDSEAARNYAHTWWSETMATRLNDQRTGCKLITMQRLHENDVAGYALAKGTYEHLNIPMRWYEGCNKLTSLPNRDPRTEDGELAWPARFDEPSVQLLETELGSYATAGQLQQTPAPRGGGRFKRAHWRFYRDDQDWLAQHADWLLESWDCTFKDGKQNDRVAGVVLCGIGTAVYWLHVSNDNLGFNATKREMRLVHARYRSAPKRLATLIEDKANGTAVIEDLKQPSSGVSGVLAIDPQGGKESRASIMEAPLEAGEYYLPDPQDYPACAHWVEKLVHEFEVFPNGAHDDIVDASSQALAWIRTRKGLPVKSPTPMAGGGARVFA